MSHHRHGFAQYEIMTGYYDEEAEFKTHLKMFSISDIPPNGTVMGGHTLLKM